MSECVSSDQNILRARVELNCCCCTESGKQEKMRTEAAATGAEVDCCQERSGE